MPSFRAAALSDIGRVRRENEDRLVCDLDMRLFGVADGVGGLPGGAEAADLAITEIVAGFKAVPTGKEPDLPHLFERANSAVGRLGRELSPGMGIGTTLTIGCIFDGAIRLAHVGDSRCYLLHDGDFVRLTEDHSVENEARMRRARGEIVYYHEANRHALTRCIGQPHPIDVDSLARPLAAGDRYLFCTDGVTRLITDRELAEMVAKHGDPATGLRGIITAAVARGGPDNATGVLLYIDQV